MDEDRNKSRVSTENPDPSGERRKMRQPEPRCDDNACGREIAELRRRLDVTQETAGIGDWLYDTATGSAIWSRQIFRLLKRDPLSGPLTFDEYLFHYLPDDAERLLESIKRVVAEKGSQVIDLRARLLQGDTVRHRCTLVPLADPDGVVTGINGFLQEFPLAPGDGFVERAGIAGTRLVGVNTGDVVFRFLLPEGVCEYISPEVQDVSGIPPREWYRNRFLVRKVVHPAWLDRFNWKFHRFINSDEPQEHVFPILSRSGELRWIQIRASTLNEYGDAISAIEGVASDITPRVNRDRIRKQHIRQLRKALSGARVLSGLLPICSFCKRIRDHKGFWQQIESFLTEHSGLFFTHGLCPECLELNYPEFACGRGPDGTK